MIPSRLRPLLLATSAALFAAPVAATVTSSFGAGVLTASSDAADAIAITCNGGNASVNGLDPGTGAVTCASVTRITVNGGPGANDLSLQAVNSGSYPALTAVNLNGGAGNDILRGSAFADILDGGPDADSVDGNQGIDIALLGDGDDTFTWDPGDGNDTVEGQGGSDLLDFNGANIAEIIDVSANGSRTRFFRNIANIVMDLGGVERIAYNALGGADVVTINDLAGTATTQVRVNLAATGGIGDGQADGVVVGGGAGAETMVASAAAGLVSVATPAATVIVATAEPALDTLSVNGGAGNDTLVVEANLAGLLASVAADGGSETDTVVARGTSAADNLQSFSPGPVLTAGGVIFLNSALAENLRIEGLDGGDTLTDGANVTTLFGQVTLDGGPGADILNGSNGIEVLDGGAGDDVLDGGQGNDLAFLGADNDTFNWDPGDGSDIVEGQAGTDLLRFNGANIAEIVSISANGTRARLFRNIAAIDMDFDGVEQIDYNALGGADVCDVGDLVATDVTRVRALLAGTLGGGTGDAQADSVVVGGSAQADVFGVGSAGGTVSVARGALTVDVLTAEPAGDRITVNGLAGDDSLGATPAAAIAVPLSFNGGEDSGNAEAGDLFVLAGEAVAENYTVTASAGGALLARLSPVSFSIAIDATERLQLDLGNGVDGISTLLLPTMRQILDGGAPASLPGDSLNVANFTGDVFVSPIVVAGLRRIDHVNFEQTTNQQLFQAFLTGRQQTPPNASTALGFGQVTLNPAQDAIAVSLGYAGLLGASTTVRLHAPAPRGVAAGSIFDLPASGATSGSFTVGPLAVTPTQVSQLKQGLWYFNVASAAPGSVNGEIRGQLDNIQLRDGFE